MDQVNSWKWVLEKCELDEIDPFEFMSVMKVKNVGFVGDSLNENFVEMSTTTMKMGIFGIRIGISLVCLAKWAEAGAYVGAEAEAGAYIISRN
ncbi:trichome birefringence-like protein 12 [Tanacetum coccineum]